MAVSVSVKVMAHPKREQYIPGLVEQLGITDDDVIWDRRQDRWDTGRRAWEAIDRDADWGCVVQDDAQVCRDFIPGLEAALAHVPRHCLVSPYTGTRRPVASRVDRAVREARATDAVFIEMPSLNWGVAITAPTRIIEDMLPWCDRQRYPNYDRRIGRYAIDVLHMPTWCTVPSLVDHRTVPSLIGHGGGRVAHNFIGADHSALDVDWTKGSIRLNEPRAAARYLGSVHDPAATPVDNRGQRGYRAARFLRVPSQDRFAPDLRPERPEGSG